MNPVTGIALGRIAVGVVSLARPDLAGSALGVPSSPPLLTRWFGTREVALGTATLLASGPGRRNLVLIGVAVDGTDAATAYAALREGSLDRSLGRGLVGVATAASVAGLLGDLRLRRRTAVVPA